MAKNLILEVIEVDNNGALFARFKKTNADGDNFGVHYIGLAPGIDIDAFMSGSAVASLASAGMSAPTTVDMDRIKSLAALVWTPAVVAAYLSQQ
jgi:hypothetical protein